MNSFLDESRNTELIRWSDNGDSFIVVDEDEFAKTLIPELFKHNNYASFVRQLNMYGFHKKVGLSDNSMRASERKNKSPSEYSNPYFKRGRPNLLWLIQKPKNPSGKGGTKGGTRIKQEDGNMDEDGDEIFDGDSPAPLNHGLPDYNPNLRNSRQPLMIDQGGGVLPRGDLANIQRELQAIRHQQQVISSMLNRTREEHRKLFGQAAAFQSLHDRHESSINAILTFLATVYNRSLEGQGGPNFANMFANAIPHDSQGQGNVVDVGEFENKTSDSNGQPQRFFRKQPLLLKAPPSNSQKGQMGGANTASPGSSIDSPLLHPSSRLPTTQNQRYQYSMRNNVAQSPAIQELSDQTHSNRSSASPQVKPHNESSDGQIPEADIMSMINSANASNTSFPTAQRMDFPQALSHLQTADGKSPLTPNQRHDVLQLMANDSANTAQNNNINALTFPSPPHVPDMAHYNLTKDQLEFIGNSLKDQDHKVKELNEFLAPLSPSGSIPGINDSQSFVGPEMLELDQIFNSGDYFNDGLGGSGGGGGGAGFGGNDIDFGNGDDLGDFNFESMAPDGGGEMGNGDGAFLNGYHTAVNGGSDKINANGSANGGGSAVETVNSSEATSPANTVDEGGGVGGLDEGSSPKKRRKRRA